MLTKMIANIFSRVYEEFSDARQLVPVSIVDSVLKLKWIQYGTYSNINWKNTNKINKYSGNSINYYTVYFLKLLISIYL